MRPLATSVVVVTGGSSGIGAAVARQARAAGADVVLADVDADAGQRLADELEAVFVRTDVRTLAANEELMQQAAERFGGIDLVHLNAGVVTGFGSLDGFNEELYRRAMGINLDGVVFGAVAALPHLRARGGGAIVATASLAGLVGIPADPVYSANKHAVVGLVRGLGPALQSDGITVNAVCPGFVETPLIADHVEAFNDAGFPLLTADDVAATVLEAAASGETGQAWFQQPGRRAEPYRFRGVPGPAVAGAEGARPPSLEGISGGH